MAKHYGVIKANGDRVFYAKDGSVLLSVTANGSMMLSLNGNHHVSRRDDVYLLDGEEIGWRTEEEDFNATTEEALRIKQTRVEAASKQKQKQRDLGQRLYVLGLGVMAAIVGFHLAHGTYSAAAVMAVTAAVCTWLGFREGAPLDD